MKFAEELDAPELELDAEPALDLDASDFDASDFIESEALEPDGEALEPDCDCAAGALEEEDGAEYWAQADDSIRPLTAVVISSLFSIKTSM
jgi:hypothetical protein